MDVIAGSVPRADGGPFQPADLMALWTSHGRNWVQLHSKLAAKGAQPVASPAMPSCAMCTRHHGIPTAAMPCHAMPHSCQPLPWLSCHTMPHDATLVTCLLQRRRRRRRWWRLHASVVWTPSSWHCWRISSMRRTRMAMVRPCCGTLHMHLRPVSMARPACKIAVSGCCCVLLLTLRVSLPTPACGPAGALDAVGLQRLLEGLGLEPTNRSVAALVQELAVPRTGGWEGRVGGCGCVGGCLPACAKLGYVFLALPSSGYCLSLHPAGLVTRGAFVQYVVSGGRTTPATAMTADTIPAAHRRADTLYRVYSIEQYTLAGALSEVAASALTPGLRAGTTLKDLAVVHHNQQQQAALAQGGDHQQQQQAQSEEQQRRVSSGGTPHALHLPTPFAKPAQVATPSSSFVQHSAGQPVPVPVLVDVHAAANESTGLLAWLGLKGGSELRATPGAAAQFGLLLLRAGDAGCLQGWLELAGWCCVAPTPLLHGQAACLMPQLNWPCQ